MPRSRLVPLLLALPLALSPAAASWMAAGGTEPSTAFDTASRMFAQSDAGPGPAGVYFQAFQSVEGLTLNPNVALLRGQVYSPGPAHHRAMLGHWKDCNGDGYVGLAESAIQDYPASLLLGPSPCTPGTPYNDGQWVSEMIGIGMVDPCEYPGESGQRPPECQAIPEFHPNERVLYANGTMVWADLGAPGATPAAECPTAPLPPGTTSGTGAMLAYADCQDGRRIARAVNTIDADGALGLRFEDENHPESSTSALNVVFPVSLFGGPRGAGLLEAGSGGRAATAWDCGDARFVRASDPTGGGLREIAITDPSGGRLTGKQPALPVVGSVTIFQDEDGEGNAPGVLRIPLTDQGDLVWIPEPAPALHDPGASWWDAAEHAADGPRGDCDPETTSAARAGAPGPVVEGGAPQVDEARKDRTSLAFTFYDGHRGLNGNIDFLTGPLTPSDAGLLFLRHGRGGVGPLWSATATTVQEPQLVARGSLDASRPLFWTYYAKVGPDVSSNGIRLPGGAAVHTYAAEACGGATSGVHRGWVCDAGLWWRDAFGNDVRPRYLKGEPFAPLPGESYHLRDVDCYDGNAGFGVGVGPVLLTESCPFVG